MDPILCNGKIKNYEPFAVYFSLSDKYNDTIRKKGFQYYFLRDAYQTKISNWRLLCQERNGFKIARFYDKNIRYLLQERVLPIISGFSNINKKKITKKIIKVIIAQFYPEYGKKMIIMILLDLIKFKKIDLDLKICVKMKKKY